MKYLKIIREVVEEVVCVNITDEIKYNNKENRDGRKVFVMLADEYSIASSRAINEFLGMDVSYYAMRSKGDLLSFLDNDMVVEKIYTDSKKLLDERIKAPKSTVQMYEYHLNKMKEYERKMILEIKYNVKKTA